MTVTAKDVMGLPVWQPADHLTSPTNAALTLCQEYAMRTWAFDDKASVLFDDSNHPVYTEGVDHTRRRILAGPYAGLVSVPFHHVAVFYGLDDAIARVRNCLWMSPTELAPKFYGGPCRECLEVRHS